MTKGKQQQQPQQHYSKAILICCLLFFAFFFLLFIRTSSPSGSNFLNQNYNYDDNNNNNNREKLCTKIPSSLSHALVKYATSKITPLQSIQEISLSLNVLSNKSPCNFLVFGLGHDSLMWASLNHGGRTVFLEEDKSWIESITRGNPSLESYHVIYQNSRSEAEQLHQSGMQPACRVVTDPRLSECQLVIKGLPSTIYDTEWDVVMVDAPSGYSDSSPGRMGAIYTVGLMARNRAEGGETHVFVHDVDRAVEDKFSNSFLCKGYMVEQYGILRHFIVPSHHHHNSNSETTTPFCPPAPN